MVLSFLQNISFDVVPLRMHGYVENGEDCVSNTPFNGTLTVIDFSEQSTGAVFNVCVLFRNNECNAVSSITLTGMCECEQCVCMLMCVYMQSSVLACLFM